MLLRIGVEACAALRTATLRAGVGASASAFLLDVGLIARARTLGITGFARARPAVLASGGARELLEGLRPLALPAAALGVGWLRFAPALRDEADGGRGLGVEDASSRAHGVGREAALAEHGERA